MERSPAQELRSIGVAYSSSRLRRIAAAINDTDRPFRFPLYQYFGITAKEAANYTYIVRRWDAEAEELQLKLQSIYQRRAA